MKYEEFNREFIKKLEKQLSDLNISSDFLDMNYELFSAQYDNQEEKINKLIENLNNFFKFDMIEHILICSHEADHHDKDYDMKYLLKEAFENINKRRYIKISLEEF